MIVKLIVFFNYKVYLQLLQNLYFHAFLVWLAAEIKEKDNKIKDLEDYISSKKVIEKQCFNKIDINYKEIKILQSKLDEHQEKNPAIDKQVSQFFKHTGFYIQGEVNVFQPFSNF